MFCDTRHIADILTRAHPACFNGSMNHPHRITEFLTRHAYAAFAVAAVAIGTLVR